LCEAGKVVIYIWIKQCKDKWFDNIYS